MEHSGSHLFVRSRPRWAQVSTMLAAVVWLASPAIEPSLADHVRAPSVDSLPIPSVAEQRIRNALARSVSLEFAEKPLDDVVAALDKLFDHQVAIQLDHRSLEDAGVNGSSATTFRIQNVPAKLALQHLLKRLNLTYLVQDDILLVTTIDQANTPEKLVVRVYPVGDLVDDRYDALIDLIYITVLPNTWDSASGGIVSMATCKSLVIRQTQEAHERILELLLALRAAKHASLSGD